MYTLFLMIKWMINCIYIHIPFLLMNNITIYEQYIMNNKREDLLHF